MAGVVSADAIAHDDAMHGRASEHMTNASRVRLPVRSVIASMLALWLAYFLLTSLRGLIVGIDFQAELLNRRSIVCLAGVLVTLGLWSILRLFDARSLLFKGTAAMVLALPAALIIAQINQLAFADIQDRIYAELGAQQGLQIRRDVSGNLLLDIPATPDIARDPANTPATPPAATFTLERADDAFARWRQLTDVALGRYFLLLAWAALYLALLAGAQAKAAERRAGEFRRAAKASELRSLRYQVNPHFLFNTLNSLSALVMTGRTDAAETMIQTMAEFYRHSLTNEPGSDMSLEQEFALQRHYLDIEQVRFPDRLSAQFDLPDNLAQMRVPGMILQPLVENCVKYAVAPHRHPVTIVLTARLDGGEVILTVADERTGAVDANGSNGEPGMGIGLTNVRDRLAARFGDGASLTTHSGPHGFTTQLRLPAVGGE